nr:hypothetical protein [Bryocella elongata]
MELERKAVVLAGLACEASSDEIACNPDGAGRGVGVVVLVMTFELETTFVDEVVVDDGSA